MDSGRRERKNNTDYSRVSRLRAGVRSGKSGHSGQADTEISRTPRDKSFLTPVENSADIVHRRANAAVEERIRFYAGQKMSRKRLEDIYGRDAVYAVLGAVGGAEGGK